MWKCKMYPVSFKNAILIARLSILYEKYDECYVIMYLKYVDHPEPEPSKTQRKESDF